MEAQNWIANVDYSQDGKSARETVEWYDGTGDKSAKEIATEVAKGFTNRALSMTVTVRKEGDTDGRNRRTYGITPALEVTAY